MSKNRRSSGKPDVNELLGRMAAKENEFLERDFFAPAVKGGAVRVRIAGVICQVRIEPPDFVGWGVFKPTSLTHAKLVRNASLAERREYLQLFPSIRLIVCRRAGDVWYGSAANFGDSRLSIEGLAPLELADEVQLFDSVVTRYDGSRFWFDEVDTRRDPGAAAYLRAAFSDETAPSKLSRPGLTAEERAAYELSFWARLRPPREASPRRRRRDDQRDEPRPAEVIEETDPVRRRLLESLSHAGARLVDYLERVDSFRVTYSVGGHQYTSSVNKDDLTVQVAGICLDGEDAKFDLTSMVGVLREGNDDGGILRIGEHGMDEEEYWRIHPPRS